MCGITGIINLDGAPVSEPILQNMTDALVHRGPAGSTEVLVLDTAACRLLIYLPQGISQWCLIMVDIF